MYKNLEQALLDLERAGMLKRIQREVDPYLEICSNMSKGALSGPFAIFSALKSGLIFYSATP